LRLLPDLLCRRARWSHRINRHYGWRDIARAEVTKRNQADEIARERTLRPEGFH
jgi:hypothetical protein